MIKLPWLSAGLKILYVLFLLYFFLTSIKLIGVSFKLFGSDFAEQLIDSYSNPVLGLATGVLATSIIQSSSTVTSLIVGLAGGGILSLEVAIPMVMGANMGTTITNILVSLTFITRRDDFRRAFSAATVHDFFNILTLVVFFPLEIRFHFIQKFATLLTDVFKGIGGVTFTSPLKYIINPVTKGFQHLLSETFSLTDVAAGIIMAVVSVTVIILSLVYLVRLLRSVTGSQAESLVDKYLFRNTFIVISLGTILTAVVQSSSVTTSIIVPLVAAGIIGLSNAYTFTLGANIGTTVTAMLASLATVSITEGQMANTIGVTVAFAHLTFNIFGVIIFLPLKRIPIYLATKLANLAAESKKWAFIFVISVFFILPLLTIFLIR